MDVVLGNMSLLVAPSPDVLSYSWPLSTLSYRKASATLNPAWWPLTSNPLVTTASEKEVTPSWHHTSAPRRDPDLWPSTTDLSPWLTAQWSKAHVVNADRALPGFDQQRWAPYRVNLLSTYGVATKDRASPQHSWRNTLKVVIYGSASDF